MVHSDCRHYRGSKPCRFKRTCDGCPHHDPIQQRILVIKLGALGDLLRTTPILPQLKAAYPHSQITWITAPHCVPLLAHLPEIDQIWTTDLHIASRILSQRFDLLLNFDKDTPAPEIAMITEAAEKKGFGLTPTGSLTTLNLSSHYALELGINDELKFFKNKKTYQQIIHEMVDLPISEPMSPYQIHLTDLEKKRADEWISQQKYDPSQSLIGINAGAGDLFATKKWPWDRYVATATRLYREQDMIPVLLGGKAELALNDRIAQALQRSKIPYFRPGEDLDIRHFMSIIRRMNGFLCGDTFAMHVALAFHIPTVILFTSTCHQEIELYDTATALIGTADCAPCYLSQCRQPTQYCAQSISVTEVVNAITERVHSGKTSENIRRRSNV